MARFFVALVEVPEGEPRPVWWAHVALAAMFVFLAGVTVFFVRRPDAEIPEPDGMSTTEQLLGSHNRAAGAMMFAFLLVVPRITAESLFNLRASLIHA